MNLTRGINLRKIAELMPGASGAEVKVSRGHGGGTGAGRGRAVGDVWCPSQGVCTEAGMYALRERRVHVTQEDFEMAVAKVSAVGELLAGSSQNGELSVRHKLSWAASAGTWELWSLKGVSSGDKQQR